MTLSNYLKQLAPIDNLDFIIWSILVFLLGHLIGKYV
jgi:hypothetical protein